MAASRTEILGIGEIWTSRVNVPPSQTGWDAYQMCGTTNGVLPTKRRFMTTEMTHDPDLRVYRMAPGRLDDGRVYRACMIRSGTDLSTADDEFEQAQELSSLGDDMEALAIRARGPDGGAGSFPSIFTAPELDASARYQGKVTRLPSSDDMPIYLWTNVNITLLTSAQSDSQVVLAQTFPNATLLQYGGEEKESFFRGTVESVAGTITAWYTQPGIHGQDSIYQTVLHGAFHNVNEARIAKTIPTPNFSAKSPGFHASDETSNGGFTVVPLGIVSSLDDASNSWTLHKLENQAAHDARTLARRVGEDTQTAILPPNW